LDSGRGNSLLALLGTQNDEFPRLNVPGGRSLSCRFKQFLNSALWQVLFFVGSYASSIRYGF
jgi:hypothetical protein